MSYPNLFHYINTNTITIGNVREACQEESNILQQNILNAVNNASTSMDETQEYLPLTQNITRAMGDFWFSIDGTIPPGGLPHLGHLVSRNVYGDFYLWLESTKVILTDEEWLEYAEANGGCCPHYSSGDGSTTFRTPKYDNAFLKTISSINEAGVYEAEGLPNITGTLDAVMMDDGRAVSQDGAFSSTTPRSRSWTGTTGNAVRTIYLNASRSNAIYGNSEHVTPKNMSILIGVYAVGAVATVGTTDAEKIISNITRIDNVLNNTVNKISSYVIETWVSGTSGYRIYSDGWIEQWGRNTVSGDGTYTVTLLKNMKDTNYNITQWIAFQGSSKTQYDNGVSITQLTTSSFTYNSYAYGNTLIWYACGY